MGSSAPLWPYALLLAPLLLAALYGARRASEAARAAYISSLSPFAMTEMACVVSLTGSLFKAAHHIAQANYPYLSADMASLCRRALFGEPITALLQRYALSHPSRSLGEALLRLIKGRVDASLLEERQARLRLEEEALLGGTRSALLSGWLYFSPLLIALAWGLGGELTPLYGVALLVMYAAATAAVLIFAGGERARLVA
jgi:hypothetical protein